MSGIAGAAMRVDTAAWAQVLRLGMGAPQLGQFSEAMEPSVLELADKRDSAPFLGR